VALPRAFGSILPPRSETVWVGDLEQECMAGARPLPLTSSGQLGPREHRSRRARFVSPNVRVPPDFSGFRSRRRNSDDDVCRQKAALPAFTLACVT
jgi:hypothetical protein